MNAAGSKLLFEETLRFDPASNVVERNRRLTGAASWSLREAFGHDDLHRLISVSYTPPIAEEVRGLLYRYDRTGTLLSAQLEQEAGGGEPARVELSLPMPRDTTGRVTALGDITLAWNPQGRLKTATSPTIRTANVYDYGGSRAWRSETKNGVDDTEAASTSLFPLSDYEEKDGRGEKVIRFAGTPVARIDAVATDNDESARPSITYFHPDHLGSPVLALDEGRAIVGYQLLYPFGAVARAGGVGMSRGFTGARREAAFGLTAFEARYLHESTGQFLSPDPALFHVSEVPLSAQALNPYIYSLNRPLTHIDLDGRAWSAVVTAGFAAWDTYQFAVGNMSGKQYAAAMALNGASLVADVATLGQGGGLAVRAANLAARGVKGVRGPVGRPFAAAIGKSQKLFSGIMKSKKGEKLKYAKRLKRTDKQDAFHTFSKALDKDIISKGKVLVDKANFKMSGLPGKLLSRGRWKEGIFEIGVETRRTWYGIKRKVVTHRLFKPFMKSKDEFVKQLR